MLTVLHHPEFIEQYRKIGRAAEDGDDLAFEVFGDISALLNILEEQGHEVEGDQPADVSHPIVTSKFRTFALRRTPNTKATPNAINPPVLRIPYVWFDTPEGPTPVVFYVGDKTTLGNQWYPQAVNKIDNHMIPEWEQRNPNTQPKGDDNDQFQERIGNTRTKRNTQRPSMGRLH